MNLMLRLCGPFLLFAWLPMVWGQTSALKVAKIEIKDVGRRRPATS